MGDIFRTHPEARLVFHTVCTRPRHDVGQPLPFGIEAGVWVDLYSIWHATVQPVTIHFKLNTTTLVSVSTVEWIIGGEWRNYAVFFSPSLHCMFVVISTVHCKLITIHCNKHVHSMYHIFTFPQICFHLTVFTLQTISKE